MILYLCWELRAPLVESAIQGHRFYPQPLELLRHPNQMQLLRDDPALIPSSIEEMLRYTPPVMSAFRLLADDTEIAGCPVSRHRSVGASLIAANRDPVVFADPDRFDVTREENRHLSFGAGIHYCLGAPLVRAQAHGALRAFFGDTVAPSND